VTTLRVATLDAPHFACGPVEVGRAWSEVELNDAAREVLVLYVGRILQLHAADIGKLGAVGLALEGGRLVEVAPEVPALPVDTKTRRR
jgi:hypothetical protein